MKKVQSMPGAAAQMAVLTAPIVTDELTLKYAESALVAAQAAFSGTTYTKDEKISSAERDLLNEVIQLRTSSSADFEKLNAAIAYSKAISENNPAVFVKPPIK
jgi:conjugative transfer pilus assembly protein TraH